jgi:hypothetical protein
LLKTYYFTIFISFIFENGITYDVYTHSDANTGAKAALWVQQGVSMKESQSLL